MRREIRAGTVTLLHVQTIIRGDTVYRYLRIPGQKRIRLPDLPPEHPDFLMAYARAQKAAPVRTRSAPGTIRAAIETAIKSATWAGLSEGYRRILRRHLDAIRDDADDAQMHHLKAAHIQADLRPLTPVQQRDRMKAWRLLCAHALDIRLIASDPSEGVRRPTALVHQGHPAWTADHITAYRSRWPIGTVQRALMELLYWTGARIGDACLIGPGMVAKDGVLTFRQGKTGDPAHVPWTNGLPDHASAMLPDRDMMHAALRASSTGHMTFMATSVGRTRSHKAAGHLIAAAAEAAGFDRSAHGLRKSRAIALAEAGANPLQIGAWTGHHSLSEIAHYVEEANRKRAVMRTERDVNSVNTPNPAVKTSTTL